MGRLEAAVVLPDFGGGGAQRVAIKLLNGLASHGREVKLISFSAEGPLASLCDPRIPIRTLGRARLRTAILPLVREIRKSRPRVVFSSLGYVNLALLLLRPLLPVATKIWVREANLPSLSLPSNRFAHWMRIAYRELYPRADKVICTSRRMREEMERDFGVPSQILCELSNPVDAVAIRHTACSPCRSPGQGRRFVAAGRLTVQKGFDRLLEMFAEHSGPEDHLTILGDGPLRDDLERRTIDLGAGGRVSYLGFLDEPWSWYAGADAFLLPSRWEGMPNAALEALACGVPVIATPESGGIAEVADQAPPGAVTVVEAGRDFVAAMQRIQARSETGLRPSLLPSAYRIESVVDRFEAWLDRDA